MCVIIKERIFMELKAFIGKVVVSAQTKRRYTLYKITSSYIDVESVEPNETGHHPHYKFETINKDPITNGYLIFEDASLKDPFVKAFNEYSIQKMLTGRITAIGCANRNRF
jgi:hypothetical protein